MNALETLGRTVNTIVERIVFILGITMAMVVAAQVFSRYVLNHSLFWSEELARYLLIWLTFLGASAAYHRKAHPGIDVLYARLSAPLQRTAAIATWTASMFLFGVMIVYGMKFAWFVRYQISPALYLPKWIVFSIIPLSGMIFLLHAVVSIGCKIRGNSRDG